MATKPHHGGYLPINELNRYHGVYGELGTSRPPLLFLDDVTPSTPELF
jgi:hypothetical protein